MKLKKLILAAFSFGLLSISSSLLFGQDKSSNMKIWFNQPALNWNDALPVGNGRLGAMIFGGIEKEHLEINEATVWTGEPRWDANPEALKSLPKVRQLLFEGKYKEAEKMAQKNILGNKPQNPAATYQALGDIYIDFGPQRGIANYKRELNPNQVTGISITFTDCTRGIRSRNSIIRSSLRLPEKLSSFALQMVADILVGAGPGSSTFMQG